MAVHPDRKSVWEGKLTPAQAEELSKKYNEAYDLIKKGLAPKPTRSSSKREEPKKYSRPNWQDFGRRPTPTPTPKPTPRPTPKPTPRPTPKPTPRPTPKPTPRPTPVPTATPRPSQARKPNPYGASPGAAKAYGSECIRKNMVEEVYKNIQNLDRNPLGKNLNISI